MLPHASSDSGAKLEDGLAEKMKQLLFPHSTRIPKVLTLQIPLPLETGKGVLGRKRRCCRTGQGVAPPAQDLHQSSRRRTRTFSLPGEDSSPVSAEMVRTRRGRSGFERTLTFSPDGLVLLASRLALLAKPSSFLLGDALTLLSPL